LSGVRARIATRAQLDKIPKWDKTPGLYDVLYRRSPVFFPLDTLFHDELKALADG